VSRPRLQLLAVAVFALAWIELSALTPRRDSGVLAIDPPTPFDRYGESESPIGRVLMVHGLDASRQSSELISAALADSGFEVYAIDLPGHGASRTAFQIDRAEQAIRNARAALGEESIVIGHSMGAGLLLDMAATDHFSTLVLLAVPPIPIGEIHADHLLFATAEFDIPRILSFLPIATDIGGNNAQSFLLSWGAHSSPIFNPGHIKRVVEWLGGDGGKTRTVARMVWIGVMLISSIVFGFACLPGRQLPPSDLSMKTVLVRYVVACSAALFALKFTHPFAWIRLFAADYLIGFLAITGLVLGVIALYGPFRTSSGNSRALIIALLAATYVITVPGLLVASHVVHFSLADGRWWRFPLIAIMSLPLFFADEVLIRRVRPRWKSETAAILTRGLLLAFVLTGVLTFNRESAFLLMVVPLIAFLWLALWFAAGVVHRHTQSETAAAVFSALVQGWAFAALFVMI
jgi:pimeloyl-ACP methyl ester carboxylesterase